MISERDLVIALAELDRVANSVGLPPDIKESAASLYRKIAKEFIDGLLNEKIDGEYYVGSDRIIDITVPAVIYAICRMHGIPRTLDEISKASGIEMKKIGRAYRFLVYASKFFGKG